MSTPIALIRVIYSTRPDRDGNRYHAQRITSTATGESVLISYRNEPDACTYTARTAGGYEVETIEVPVGQRELRRISGAGAIMEHMAQGAVWRLLPPEYGAPGLAKRLRRLVDTIELGVNAENDGSLCEERRYAKTNNARIAREDLAALVAAFGATCSFPGIYPMLEAGVTCITIGPDGDAGARWLYAL